MKFLRPLGSPLVAAALLFATGGIYFPPVATTQKVRSAHPSKPDRFHYVCPMHEDVTSKKPGKCYKCKMKLEKKRIKESTDS